MKLIKKDFNKWDKEELSLIVDGYTARQIADYILANQKIVDRLLLAKGKYHGKEGYEFVAGVLESILEGKK